MSFRVAPYSGGMFCVKDGYSEVVDGPFATRKEAQHAKVKLDNRTVKNATERKRPCMRCQKVFLSKWIGNRLCPNCRNVSGGLI